MSKEEHHRESVRQVTGDFAETQSRAWHHEGSYDYTNTYIGIKAIVDASGEEHDPVWETEPKELCPGVITWEEDHVQRLRISREACPVRVLFRDFSEYVSYTDGEHNWSSTRLFWVRFERSPE